MRVLGCRGTAGLAPAGLSSIVRSAEIVFANIFQAVLLGQVQQGLSVVGSVLVLLAVSCVGYGKLRAGNSASAPRHSYERVALEEAEAEERYFEEAIPRPPPFIRCRAPRACLSRTCARRCW